MGKQLDIIKANKEFILKCHKEARPTDWIARQLNVSRTTLKRLYPEYKGSHNGINNYISYSSKPKHCKFCNNILSYSDRYKVFCNHSCSASFSNSRRCVSDATKRKISSTLTKPKKHFVKKCLVCNVEFVARRLNRKTCSAKCSRALGVTTNKTQKHIWTKKISETRKKMFIDGQLKVTGGTANWINIDNIKVQGSYEARAVKILNALLKLGKIEKWEYCKERVKYIGEDGNIHTYIIDFSIVKNGVKSYIEVKGFLRQNDLCKWKEARKTRKLRVWFLKHIRRYENLLNIKK